MIALTDRQLQSVMTAAGSLEPDRRDIFLQRVGVMLRMRSRFTDADVVEVAQLAVAGLVRQTTDVASYRVCGHDADTQIRRSAASGLHHSSY
jgi:hypothetical protein